MPMTLLGATLGDSGSLVWFVSILGAGTVGAFAMKLLDVLLFDRWTKRREFRNWMRDRRIEVFSPLVGHPYSIETDPETRTHVGKDFEARARALLAEAMLLLPDGEALESLRRLQSAWDAVGRVGDFRDGGTEVWAEFASASKFAQESLRAVVTGDRM